MNHVCLRRYLARSYRAVSRSNLNHCTFPDSLVDTMYSSRKPQHGMHTAAQIILCDQPPRAAADKARFVAAIHSRRWHVPPAVRDAPLIEPPFSCTRIGGDVPRPQSPERVTHAARNNVHHRARQRARHRARHRDVVQPVPARLSSSRAGLGVSQGLPAREPWG